ncbi:CRAL-TRIO domain-containing protein [Abortiporus biennis]|nr:CRAL-TRIO domain-containing protein [Abortiporus biennis]
MSEPTESTAPVTQHNTDPAPEVPPAPVAEEAKEEAKTEPETTAEPEPEPEIEEVQNALTKQFTAEEWKALKELRKQLPEIVKEAYEDAETKPETVTLWGVTIDPAHPETDAKVSVVLTKFLRARELDVAAARTMLVSTLKWRQQFKIDEVLKEEFPEEVFGKVGFVKGVDKEGRPVTYNLYGGPTIKEVFSDVGRFTRWRVQLMEKTVLLLDFENHDQMIQVHDYDGVSMFRDANQKEAAHEATNIFQNHYPEFLAWKYFVNVPTLLTWIFWLFKPLISPKTFAKMTVVGHGPSAIGKEVLPKIDKEQLPKKYGGEAEDLV